MISIVIPALNEEKLLPDCLQSLKNQDYQGEYEIILADNGSTDRTASIARNFGVKVVACPEQRSVFYAREIGARAARGEIIVQADADTVYPRGWLRRIAEQFARHPETAAVTGRFKYVAPPRWAVLEYGFRHAVNWLGAVFLNRPLCVSGATFAFRRRDFEAVNGYRDITYSADQYGLAGRLRKMGKVRYDSGLCVRTSSRTVDKPFPIVLFDAFNHLYRWTSFLSTSSLGAIREFNGRSRRRRIATRLSIPVMCLILFAAYGYYIPASPVFGKVYYKARSTENIALTFDDGPNEPYTSQILDILKSHEIKATFFLIGRNIELYPETAKRILAEGHVIGNHSYQHNPNHALTEEGSQDLYLAQQRIYLTLGVAPHLYRPPHGKKSPWELQNLKKMGLIEVTWSVSTRELGNRSAEEIAHDITEKAKPGAIILIHDGYGTSHDIKESDKSRTVAALPEIIEQLEGRGYCFVTVPELLGVPAYISP